MATKIILKKSSVASQAPVAGDLEPGELAINLADKMLFSKRVDGTIIDLSPAGFPAFSVIPVTGDTNLTNTHFSGNKMIEVDSAGAVTLTLNTGLTGVEPLLIEQKGAGQVTIAGTATLRNRSGLKTAGQYAVISIIPKGSDRYTIGGDTTA